MSSAGKPIRLLLTGGGTGGHLFPAIAAAEEMKSRNPGSTVMFIGTRRKTDKASLAGYGYMVKSIYSYGLKGKKLPELLKALAVLPVSFLQSLVCLIRFRPDVVLGVGGYVTGPVIAAARVLGKKTVIHEQNSIPGLANRQLGRIAGRICISLPDSAKYFPQEKTVLTGNPVRKPILELASAESWPKDKDTTTLLVLGGSQGAHRLNELVVEAVCSGKIAEALRVIHQTGAADYEMVRSMYEKNGIDADVQPFFRDMAEVYKRTDFLVSRAGATTLAELAVLGKPAILVPFPHAADNHQDKNADYYVAGGGCLKSPENELTASVLAKMISEMVSDRPKRQRMATAMKRLGMPEAARKIVDICQDSRL